MAPVFPFRLNRTGDVPLEFTGTLLVDLSSHMDGMSRWSEVRIYSYGSHDAKRWVTEVVGRSVVPGEIDRSTVAVHQRPEHVRKGLMRTDSGSKYLTHLAERALSWAALVDPDLVEKV